jgi:hypothetical protein
MMIIIQTTASRELDRRLNERGAFFAPRRRKMTDGGAARRPAVPGCWLGLAKRLGTNQASGARFSYFGTFGAEVLHFDR